MSSKAPRQQHSSSARGSVSSGQKLNLRQLFESLSGEQRRNQDLLASLSFAQRSFTNLNRFLELVPVVASRLLMTDGALLVPFQSDGRIWREQIHLVSVPTFPASETINETFKPVTECKQLKICMRPWIRSLLLTIF